jgi:hypothetical protein
VGACCAPSPQRTAGSPARPLLLPSPLAHAPTPQVKHSIKMPRKMYIGVMKKRKEKEARKAEELRLSGVITGRSPGGSSVGGSGKRKDKKDKRDKKKARTGAP